MARLEGELEKVYLGWGIAFHIFIHPLDFYATRSTAFVRMYVYGYKLVQRLPTLTWVWTLRGLSSAADIVRISVLAPMGASMLPALVSTMRLCGSTPPHRPFNRSWKHPQTAVLRTNEPIPINWRRGPHTRTQTSSRPQQPLVERSSADPSLVKHSPSFLNSYCFTIKQR